MKKFIAATCCCIVMLLISGCSKSNTMKNFQQDKYFSVISYKTDNNFEGIDGTVELLQDIRLKTRKQTQCMEVMDTELGQEETPEDKRAIYRNAILRIRLANGKVVFMKELDSAWIYFYRVKLYDNDVCTYFIRADYSRGYGPSSFSYITKLYEIKEKQFKQLKFKYADKRKATDDDIIELYYNMRSNFEIVDSKSGKGKNLLQVHKWLASDKVVYSRYEYEGKRWMLYEKTVEGFYESSEGNFPDLSNFYW